MSTMSKSYTVTKDDFESIAEYRDDLPGLDEHEAAIYVLYKNGRCTHWYFYELLPSSRYYDRGLFGMVIENQEPQFATYDDAVAALIEAYEAANGIDSDTE